MALKVYKPNILRDGGTPPAPPLRRSPGASPHKALLLPLKRKAGRNVRGKITVRHPGRGAPRRRLRDHRF